MSPFRSAWLACVLAACSGGGRGEMKVRGSNPETIGLDDSGPPPANIKLTPILFDGALQFPLRATTTTRLWGEKPTVTLQMSPLVGQMNGMVFISGVTVGKQEFLPHSFFIDEWTYTGDGSHPFHIRGRTADPSVHTPDPDVEITHFEADTYCANKFVTPGPGICGGSPRDDIPKFTVKLGTGAGLACPAEVVTAIVGQGEGATATYQLNSSFSVQGGASMGCVATMEGSNSACGVSKTVQAGSCSWKVSSWAAPAWNGVSQRSTALIFVGAVTTSGCATPNFCDMVWTGVEQ